jgi:hypothetical protein
MRVRTAFLSCTVVALAASLLPTEAMATFNTCSSYNYTVTVESSPLDGPPGVKGPCAVADPANPVCVSQGAFTGIQYKITGSAKDYVATLVTRNNTVAGPGCNQVYAACAGEPATELGKLSCHESALRLRPFPATQSQFFWVVVAGRKQAIETSIAIKKGSCVKSYAVPGLGVEGPSVFQTTKKTETITFKGCAVTFELNAVTGDVINVFNDPDKSSPAPGETCSPLMVNGVDKLNLTLDGVDLGSGQIGEGYISTGTNSCTTRVVGGKVYTWGAACPN